MRRHLWLASIPYGIVAIVSAVLGCIYLFRGRFMPYHAEALGLEWADVEPDLQVLLTALMQVAGAGWLALAVALGALLRWPFRGGALWARLTIPALIVTFYLPTFVATISVSLNTPATAPWYGNLASLIAAMIGVLLDFALAHPANSPDPLSS